MGNEETPVVKAKATRMYTLREFMGLNQVKSVDIKPTEKNNNPMLQVGNCLVSISKQLTPDDVIKEAETLVIAEFPDAERGGFSHCIMRRAGLKNEVLGTFSIE